MILASNAQMLLQIDLASEIGLVGSSMIWLVSLMFSTAPRRRAGSSLAATIFSGRAWKGCATLRLYRSGPHSTVIFSFLRDPERSQKFQDVFPHVEQFNFPAVSSTCFSPLCSPCCLQHLELDATLSMVFAEMWRLNL